MDLARPIRNVVFAGSRALGAETVQILHEKCAASGRTIVGVVAVRSDPDRQWWAAEDKRNAWTEALARGLPLVAQDDLLQIDYDLLLSVYWHRIFPPAVLDRAALNVNLHTAPLPECRGRYSCSMAILAGDHEFGPTLHLMEPAVDAGAVIAARRFPIAASDTARQLYDRTNKVSVTLLREWIHRILDGDFDAVDQLEIAKSVGRPVRFFGADALDRYARPPNGPLSGVELDVRRRGLTFPPRYAPPAWMNGRCDDSIR